MKLRKNFVVRIGGNEYADTPDLLAFQGNPVLTVKRGDESGDLDVRLDVYDERGRERARVRDAEVVKGDSDSIDIRVTENSYTVFDRNRKRVLCELRRRGHARDMDLDAWLLLHTPDGFLVHANPDQTNLRVRRSENVLTGRDAALQIR